MKTFAIPLTVNYHHGIPWYWHVCYSEYKNRLVHVANCSQVFPCNSILHTNVFRFCHQRRCGSKWDLMTQILGLILWFSLSLPRLLSGRQDGGFVVLFFQLIFITGTHKTAQASLPPFIISHRNSGASQGCRKPSPMARTQPYKTFTLLMQIPALYLQDLGRPARENCHSSDLTQGTDRVAGNC